MHVSTAEGVAFHRLITDYYYEFGRHDMLWRTPDAKDNIDPYKVLVSEMMLQQTQVDRVTPKYTQFLHKFPTVHDLARARLSEVLKVWNGLGYNRRAKYILEVAQAIEHEHGGTFPTTIEELKSFPGIGRNTAGAILAYAFNKPVLFVETNIRTVIIHHFFSDKNHVEDKDILAVLEALVPNATSKEAQNAQGALLTPRQFYWALMDYGTYLKKTVGNLNRSSKHYSKQSTFQGSKRQIRGQVIKLLTEQSRSQQELANQIADERLDAVIMELQKEHLVVWRGNRLHLK